MSPWRQKIVTLETKNCHPGDKKLSPWRQRIVTKETNYTKRQKNKAKQASVWPEVMLLVVVEDNWLRRTMLFQHARYECLLLGR